MPSLASPALGAASAKADHLRPGEGHDLSGKHDRQWEPHAAVDRAQRCNSVWHRVDLRRPNARRAEAAAPTPPRLATPRPPAPTAAPDTTERPDLVIWHYKDPRLQSQQQVQESSDKSYNYLSIYRVPENKFFRLADEAMRTVTPQAKDAWAIGTDSRDYDVEGATDGPSYRDVYAVSLTTGDRRLIKKQVRWAESGSPDGAKWMYYENRNFFVYDMATGVAKNITEGEPFSVVDSEDDHNVVDPPRHALGWTSDSARRPAHRRMGRVEGARGRRHRR